MTKEKFINECMKYKSVREGSFKHKEIVKTYNCIKPLPQGYKLKYTDSWCAGFVSAVAYKCGFKDFPFECSVARMVEKAKKQKLWIEDESITPNEGWLAVYAWKDTNPKSDNRNTPNHVGVITKVTPKYITVLEGNYNDVVAERKIEINGKFLRGFVALKYSTRTEK